MGLVNRGIVGGGLVNVAPVRSRVVGGGFVPTDLGATLKLWLPANGTYWKDSARTTSATADTDPVGAWDDASGNGSHALQATPGSRPTLQTGEVNGLPSIEFDAIDDLLESAAKANGSACTVWAVVKMLAAGGFTYAFGEAHGFRGLRVPSSTQPSWCDAAGDFQTPDALGTSVYALWLATSDGSTAKLRINGVQKASGSSSSTTFGVNGGGDGVQLGAGAGGSRQQCRVAEAGICDTELTGADLSNLESYTLTKFGF